MSSFTSSPSIARPSGVRGFPALSLRGLQRLDALYRQRRTLGRLDDRMLEDIGVSRGNADARSQSPGLGRAKRLKSDLESLRDRAQSVTGSSLRRVCPGASAIAAKIRRNLP